MVDSVESPDDVVISGIAIRCSMCDNIDELAENLYSGVNMVHEDLTRVDQEYIGIPKQHGFIKDIRKFDATFFGVHPKQADGMDPQLRIIHEVAYESIVDAGIDPASMKNSNTGVYIGVSNSDAREAWTSGEIEELDGYSLIGTHRAFLANRLSFIFDLRGPSFGIDAACATSGVAVNEGYLHIKNGTCEAALVGGVSLVYQPKVSYQLLRLGLLCRDGKCKVFDDAADGYVRSEAIAVILLQKRRNANRVYATVVHSKVNNDGFKEQGITFPSTESQAQLVSEVYAEAGIDMEDVEFVETHGTGTKIGDPQETNGIALAFSNARSKPLLIGSIKSNMGHTEHASGAVGVCKLVLAIQTGILPPNIHYQNPNTRIPALLDGRLEVVTKPTKWNSTIIGMNCFGFGGLNTHLVLRGNPKTRQVKNESPLLVLYMGRTADAAKHALEYANRYPDDPYVPYLLMQTAYAKPASMPFRGYVIVNHSENSVVVERVSTKQRPIWFVFSGQGTQWPAMGKSLLHLESFKQSVSKCGDALRPFGVDLVDLLENCSNESFTDPVVSFVGIAAIQIALVDLLYAMKINAEGFVGHSAGEIGCAYADGCLTREEAILAAYWRGRAVKENELPAGAMASVGLSWEQAKNRCQLPVVPACNNAKDNVTISGPTQAVGKLVEELKAEKIFVKEVNSNGIAFHSPDMEKAAPAYLKALTKVIINPKVRTARWISTAVEETSGNSDVGKFASAEYFAYNLTHTVKFHEALSKVPQDAIVIEVAPHGLLQALIVTTVGSQCLPVSLMKRGHADNLIYFLESVGKLYIAGSNPRAVEIFPKPPLPAPRDVPFLGPVVKWDHSASWRIPFFTDFLNKNQAKEGYNHSQSFDFSGSVHSHYLHFKLGGKSVFPLGGFIGVVAKCYARAHETLEQNLRVLTVKNLEVLDAVFIRPGQKITFDVNFLKSSGSFEVCHEAATILTGSVSESRYIDGSAASCDENGWDTPGEAKYVPAEDIYSEFRARGADFGPKARLLKEATADGTTATLTYIADYEAAIDAVLQLAFYSQNKRNLQTVDSIQSLVVNVSKFAQKDNTDINAHVNDYLNSVCCSGVTADGLVFKDATNRRHQIPVCITEYEIGAPTRHGRRGSISAEWGELVKQDSVIYQSDLLDIQTNTSSAVAKTDQGSGGLRWYEGPVQNAGRNRETLAIQSAVIYGKEPRILAISAKATKGHGNVAALVPSIAVASHVAVDPLDLIAVPENVSFDVAANAVFSYGLSHFSLVNLAYVAAGQTVLIYVTGSAEFEAAAKTSAILGLKTILVGNVDDNTKSMLKGDFRIFRSLKDPKVVREILELTSNQGVQVVYNPTSADKFRESASALAAKGHYLQLYGDSSDSNMAKKTPAIHTNIVKDHLPKMSKSERQQTTEFLRKVFQGDNLNLASMKVAFNLRDMPSDAVQSGAPILLHVRSDESASSEISAFKRAVFHADKSYVIFGDSDDFLLDFAYWIATLGARHILLSTQDDAVYSLASYRRYFEALEADIQIVAGMTPEKTLLEATAGGPLGGVFLFDHVQDGGSSISVSDVDGALQANGWTSNLEYFVVFTSAITATGNTSGRRNSSLQLACDRKRAGAPVQVIDIGNFVKGNSNVSLTSALDALSTVLRYPARVVALSVAPQKAPVPDGNAPVLENGIEGAPHDKSYLPQALSKIMGIKDFATLEMFLTLGDYGMDSLMAIEFGKILERDFELFLTLQEIRSLNVRDICLMAGVSNAVDAAKLFQSQSFVAPTFLESAKKHYNLTELVPKNAIVLLRQVRERKEIMFLVHPMEGSVVPIMESLANHMQVTTYGINCTADADLSSVETLAASYIKEIQKVQPKGPYLIGGYSFGATVAFEMALQLQKSDSSSVKHVILLDGSHSFVAAFTKTMKNTYTVDSAASADKIAVQRQDAFEVALCALFISQFIKTQQKQLADRLRAAHGLDNKIGVLVEEFKTCPELSDIKEDDIRTAASAFVRRLICADAYKPGKQYVGPVTLIKCTEKMIRSLGDMYELEKVCSDKNLITTMTVPGNHEEFILGDNARVTASVVSKVLLV